MSSPAPASAMPPVMTSRTVWRPTYPVNVRLTLSVLRRGGGDPTHRTSADGTIWRTSRMRSGPVTYRLSQRSPHEIVATAWGDGAAELIDGLPALLGSRDDPDSFEPRHPLLAQAHRRFPGLRIPATGRVLEALIPAVIEQKVVGLDATAAYRRLITKYGDTPPGPAPAGMRVPPTAATWLAVPSWEWNQAGVDARRTKAARVGATYSGRLEAAAAANPSDPMVVHRMLTSLPGIGVWTAAQVGHRALGDADALPLGDYHLAPDAGWALTGAALPEDEVEAFFEPWRPHRYRVVRLLELTGSGAPRRGPRMTRQDYRKI